MSERGNEKMTEWLDIKLDTLSSEEVIKRIEEYFCDPYPAGTADHPRSGREARDKVSLWRQKRQYWRR